MSDPIHLYLKASSTPGAVPTAAQLPERLLAINLADKKLFFNAGGSIYQILQSQDVAPAVHTHSISSVTGLQDALNALSSSVSSTGAAALQSEANLSDVASASSARTNLDVFSKGEVSSAISSASSDMSAYADLVSEAARNEAEAYADQSIASLIASSPETLNTLKEIADALAAADSVAVTLAAQIGEVSGRVGTLEGQNLDSRVSGLEGVNIGTRLGSLESGVASLEDTAIAKANNLSDVQSAATARANLDVYSQAEEDQMFTMFDGGTFDGGGTEGGGGGGGNLDGGAPAITADSNVYVQSGASFTLSASITGQNLSYVWKRYSNENGWEVLSGETGPTFTGSASWPDGGVPYLLEVSNRDGTVSHQFAVQAGSAPVASSGQGNQPINVTYPGPDGNFGMQFPVYNAGLFQWQSSSDELSWTDIPGAITDTLSLNQSSWPNGGSFRCVASNLYGSITSYAVPISPYVAPIQLSVSVTAEKTDLVLNENVVLNIQVSDNWSGTANVMSNGSQLLQAVAIVNGVGSYSYADSTAYSRVIKVVVDSNGSYLGAQSSDLYVNWMEAALIFSQPVGGVIPKGLSVDASNATAWQWYKDGVAIAGATYSSYWAYEAGDYYVVVSNPASSVQSNTVTVTAE